MKPYIYDVSLPDLDAWVEAHHHEPYRVRQIRSWLWKGVTSSEEMLNLPEKLRRDLAEAFEFDGLEVVERIASKLDDTCKYVSRLADGQFIETVFMKYKAGTSVCITTQVGCRMGCSFCASTLAGYARNLTTGEMLAQVAMVGKDQAQRIDHVVLMGIGEPFDNYENVVRFLKVINDPKVFNIGMRKITLSTCGLVPEMYRFMEEKLPLTLAVSLHAPNDEIRQRIMPIAKRYDMETLMKACRDYVNATSRRITFEYNLMDGINDQDVHAHELAKRLGDMLCHVNLIPMNDVPESPYTRTKPERLRQFQSILEQYGLNVTVRRELGADIAAACGQLRRRHEQ